MITGKFFWSTFDDSDVSLLVGADDMGIKLALIAQQYFDLIDTFHHMVIGEHIAVGVDDHTRSQTVLPLLARCETHGKSRYQKTDGRMDRTRTVKLARCQVNAPLL